MTRRDTLRLSLGLLLTASASHSARAAFQTCGGVMVSNDVIRCPNGEIPSYAYGNPPAPTLPAESKAATSSNVKTRFLGVWHTGVEGIGHAGPGDVAGSSAMEGAKISLRAGDITIAPNGAFVWNTLTGSFGRWVALIDGWDFLLIEQAGHDWHCKIDTDGRLLMSMDPQHELHATR